MVWATAEDIFMRRFIVQEVCFYRRLSTADFSLFICENGRLSYPLLSLGQLAGQIT